MMVRGQNVVVYDTNVLTRNEVRFTKDCLLQDFSYGMVAVIHRQEVISTMTP